jgi:aminoglycoside phosphotransferase family enzyme/predicted kinase
MERFPRMLEDQAATIAFLKQPSTYGLSTPVEVMETHISMIFLAGERAFKLKRAVRLPYLDFSTPPLRLAACEKEVELNTRTAPGLYLGVRPIRRKENGELTFDGVGEFVDAVVEMMRFEQDCLFDQMAVEGTLELSHMDQIAGVIVEFHRAAPVVHTRGGAATMRAILDINEAAFAGSPLFPPDAVQNLNARLRSALEHHASLLDRREAMGKVRRCHGDLHLRNICLLNGVPRLFDCIEFNDAIATVDTLYDLAFLLMDLWHRDLPHFANPVINRYLDARYFDEAGDDDGFCLLPFFMALRAAIRAHVTATQIVETAGQSDELLARAQSYFQLASALLQPTSPCLVAIGGLSGSGKTTVAELLAPRIGSPPGARILESDRIRKAMHGVSPETRLAEDAYRADISAKVYAELGARARLILSGGGVVVVDAVFAKASDRLLLERMARDVGAKFAGIWLETGADVLRGRVQCRTGGPSDATVEVLERQLQQDLGPIDWMRLDAGASAAGGVEQILQLPLVSARPSTG